MNCVEYVKQDVTILLVHVCSSFEPVTVQWPFLSKDYLQFSNFLFLNILRITPPQKKNQQPKPTNSSLTPIHKLL